MQCLVPLCRAATYNGLLLAAAQQHPRFVEGLERQLAVFVADKELKRWVSHLAALCTLPLLLPFLLLPVLTN